MPPIKIVSWNTYLVANLFNKNRQTFPEWRASKMHTVFNDTHLTFLQEVWGTGLDQLVDQKNDVARHTLLSIPEGRRLPRWCAWLSSTPLSEMATNFYFRFLKTGGLYDLSLSGAGISCRYRKKHTFSVSRSRSLKGVEATLWDVPQWDISDPRQHGRGESRRQLLVFNTHTDPWAEENRKIQVREILDFMNDTFREIDSLAHSNWMSRTGVLIVGDFNTKACSREHRRMIKEYGWLDYFDDGTDSPENVERHTYALRNMLTCYPDDCGRIDYAFGVRTCGEREFLPLVCQNPMILVQDRGSELSDHYPIGFDLVPAK